VKTLTRNDIPKLEEYWMQQKENIKMVKFREWELLSKESDD